jgi:hypothetical protein
MLPWDVKGKYKFPVDDRKGASSAMMWRFCGCGGRQQFMAVGVRQWVVVLQPTTVPATAAWLEWMPDERCQLSNRGEKEEEGKVEAGGRLGDGY